MATILLASEDAHSAGLLTSELEAEGHRVVTACTGQEACDLVLAESPAFVFVGMNLPVFNGLETCRMLRDDPAVPPSLPIYLLADAPPDSRTIEKAGLNGCLSTAHSTNTIRDLLAAHAVLLQD